METKIQINQKLIKRKILELAKTKKELNIEKGKNMAEIVKIMKPKLPIDILDLDDIKEQYGYSKKTIYRYRCKGLKYSKSSEKGYVHIVRKDLEDFLKKDMYDL